MGGAGEGEREGRSGAVQRRLPGRVAPAQSGRVRSCEDFIQHSPNRVSALIMYMHGILLIHLQIWVASYFFQCLLLHDIHVANQT